MPILSLLTIILRLADTLSRYAYNRQLIEAGKHEAHAEATKKIIDDIKKSRTAKSRVTPAIIKQLRERYRK